MFLALAFSIYLVPLFVAAVDAVDDTLPEDRLHAGRDQGPGGEPRCCCRSPGPTSGRRCGSASASAGATSSWPRWWTSAAALGGIIITSQRRGPREHIYLVLVIIVAVAFLTDQAVGRGRPAGSSPTGRPSDERALPPVIEFKGVSKTFNPGTPAQFTALKDINFRDRRRPRTTASSSRSSAPRAAASPRS